MSGENPTDYHSLEKLLENMQRGLGTQIERVEANVNKRLDKFEIDMERYVLKEVHQVEIQGMKDEIKSQAAAVKTQFETEQAKDREKAESFKQKVTWAISILSFTVAVIVAVGQFVR